MNPTGRLPRKSTDQLLTSQLAAYADAFRHHLTERRYGHESTTTTHRYVEANLEMKAKTLARLQEPDTKMRRYQPPDDLMKFLQAL